MLVPKIREEKCLWIGRRISVEHTDEVVLALSYIEKVLITHKCHSAVSKPASSKSILEYSYILKIIFGSETVQGTQILLMFYL